MERRVALKQMALATGGLLVLPTWANAWTKTSVQVSQRMLGANQVAVLTEVVDTLIPASDSLGAKALGVADFVQKMIADCYEAPVQETFKIGLDTVDTVADERFHQSFLACDTTQRLAVLQAMETAPETDQKSFYALLKNLTIQGFTTSEYVMTKFYNYTMIPGHFYGCVPAPIATK
ncbi:hypothetical protein GCM10027341_12200 [Spirosoma knui]